MRQLCFSFFVVLFAACTSGIDEKSLNHEENEARQALQLANSLNEQEKYDSAITVMKHALALTAASDSTLGMLNAELSAACLFKGDMRQAVDYGNKALGLLAATIDAETDAILNGNIGVAYRRLGMNDSAAICYRKGIEAAGKNADYSSQAYLCNNLSVLYCELERYEESLSYARRAVYGARKSNDQTELYSALANEGVVYVKQGLYRKAADHLSRVYDKADSLKSTPLKLKTINYLLAACRNLNDESLTDYYLSKGERLAKEFPPGSTAVLGIYEAKMSILVKRGRYREALDAARRLDAVEGQNVMPAYKLRMLMAKCYAALGDYKTAYKLEKEAEIIQDSINGADVKRQLSEYTMRFKTMEKELEISRLRSEKAARRTLMSVITVVMLLVIAVLAVILLRLNHKRKMRAKQTEIDLARRYIDGMENEKAKFARELHDGACNELLAIGMRMNADKPDKELITGEIRALRTSLRRLSHEMMPPSFKYADIDEILQDYVSHLLKPDTLMLDYCSEGKHWDNIQPETAYQLYRITQESVGNIIRHSEATKGLVSLCYNAEGIRLTVSDNGKGLSPDNHGGVGLRAMNDRAGSIGAVLNVNSGACGTRIEVVIKTTDNRSF